MKGIILAGGLGSRLLPLTKIVNNHCLPVYDKQMIFYPLETLIRAGIKDILLVVGKGHAGDFLELLGDGTAYGVKINYTIQEKEGGIAQALGLAENFANGDDIAVILGDNIFLDHFYTDVKNFNGGSRIFLAKVKDPQRFGVARMEGDIVKEILEKPVNPPSEYAVTGLYLYDRNVFEYIKTLRPSHRGELEITDVNNQYIATGKMTTGFVKDFWSDAGTFDSLMSASNYMMMYKSMIKGMDELNG